MSVNIYVCEVKSQVAQLCPTLCDPMDLAHQTPLSTGFLKQEYWSGLPFPSPGDLPNPGKTYIYIYTHTHIHTYIYTYGEKENERERFEILSS